MITSQTVFLCTLFIYPAHCGLGEVTFIRLAQSKYTNEKFEQHCVLILIFSVASVYLLKSYKVKGVQFLSIAGDTRQEKQDIFPIESSSLPSNEMGASQSMWAMVTK